MLTVSDSAGRVLSDIRVRPGDSYDSVVIVSAAYPEALMRHYFHGGRSEVVLSFGPHRVQGRIETRWERGARVWSIRTTAPLDARDLEAAAANAAVPGMRPLTTERPSPAETARLLRVF